MNKKELMYQRIKEHGEKLNKIFNTGLDPIVLCKKLKRLENKAHHATTCLCNTNTLDSLYSTRPWDLKEATEEEQDIFFSKIIKSLESILKMDREHAGFFINYDPRGYALKIKSDTVKENALDIYQDFGGYGIIAPDFRE